MLTGEETGASNSKRPPIGLLERPRGEGALAHPRLRTPPVAFCAKDERGDISYWGVALRPADGTPHGNAVRHAVRLRRALGGRSYVPVISRKPAHRAKSEVPDQTEPYALDGGVESKRTAAWQRGVP